MGMSGLIFDNEDKFWNIAFNIVDERDTVREFVTEMRTHTDLLLGNEMMEGFEFELYRIWNENKHENQTK